MEEPLPVTSRSPKVKYKMPEHEARAGYVERNFDEIAPNYDLFNDLATFGLHRLWKRATVASVRLPDGRPTSVLDLCAGTGDLSLLASRKLPAGSRIAAVDFSEGMLAILRRRAQERGAALEISRGDATQLSALADSTFDGVMIGFGLRNVDNREACLSEMRRVLRPGGRLAILDVGHVRLPIVRTVHRFFFERIVPLLGNLIQGRTHEMYAYLPASARLYPTQEELVLELERAGFHKIRYRNFLFGSTALHVARK